MFKMNLCDVSNETESSGDYTGNKKLYETLNHILYGYMVPAICICGFFGNVLNLVILAGKRQQRALREKERSANLGLIALAVADMSFCITAFPSTFLPMDMRFPNRGVMIYYGCYCAAVINIFIMTSTWLTVTMSTERYLAICHPLRSRNIITLQRTKLAIVLVFICSMIFNVPVFWRYAIVEIVCDNETVAYSIYPQVLYGNESLDHAYRAVWAVLGNFVPLIMLLFFNVALVREIHKSNALRKKAKALDRQLRGEGGMILVHHTSSDVEPRSLINITLVAIVVMFFILVAPSEILKHVTSLFGQSQRKNYTYLTVELVTNIMQGINFSANFILYCIIIPSFRRRMKEMICSQSRYRGLSVTVYSGSGGSVVWCGWAFPRCCRNIYIPRENNPAASYARNLSSLWMLISLSWCRYSVWFFSFVALSCWQQNCKTHKKLHHSARHDCLWVLAHFIHTIV